MSRSHRAAAVSWLVVAACLALSACGVPRMVKPSKIADRDVPPAVSAPTTSVDVYFFYESRLRLLRRSVAIGAEPITVVKGVADAVRRGPTADELALGYTSRLGDYSFGVSRLDDATAVVELPSEGTPGGGLEGDSDAMAQLVWTLTAIDGVSKVSLERDGTRLPSARADGALSVVLPVDTSNYQTFGFEEEPTIYLLRNGRLSPVKRTAPAPTDAERRTDAARIASGYLDLLANGPRPNEREQGYTSLAADLEAKVRVEDAVPVLVIANAAAFDRLAPLDQARALAQMLYTIDQAQLPLRPVEIEVGTTFRSTVAGPNGNPIRAPLEKTAFQELLEPVSSATTTTVV